MLYCLLGGKWWFENNSNFVMLYVHWVENDDLKTTAWREQDLNGTDIIHKKCG